MNISFNFQTKVLTRKVGLVLLNNKTWIEISTELKFSYIKQTKLRKVLDGFKIHGITNWHSGHESLELNYDSV